MKITSSISIFVSLIVFTGCQSTQRLDSFNNKLDVLNTADASIEQQQKQIIADINILASRVDKNSTDISQIDRVLANHDTQLKDHDKKIAVNSDLAHNAIDRINALENAVKAMSNSVSKEYEQKLKQINDDFNTATTIISKHIPKIQMKRGWRIPFDKEQFNLSTVAKAKISAVSKHLEMDQSGIKYRGEITEIRGYDDGSPDRTLAGKRARAVKERLDADVIPTIGRHGDSLEGDNRGHVVILVEYIEEP